MTPIDQLPLDVLLQIFAYLDDRSLTNAEGVCVKWRQHIITRRYQGSDFYKQLYEKYVTAGRKTSSDGNYRALYYHARTWKYRWRAPHFNGPANPYLSSRVKSGFDAIHTMAGDAQHLVTGGDHIKVWERSTGSLLYELYGMQERYPYKVSELQMTPQHLVSVSSDNRIELWDRQSGYNCQHTISFPGTLPIRQLQVDDHRFAFISNLKVLLYDGHKGVVFDELDFAPYGRVDAMTFCKGNLWIATLDHLYLVPLNAPNFGTIKMLPKELAKTTTCLQTDGQIVAVGGQTACITLWDIRQNKPYTSAFAHQQPFESLNLAGFDQETLTTHVFSPSAFTRLALDDTKIVGATEAGMIYVWDKHVLKDPGSGIKCNAVNYFHWPNSAMLLSPYDLTLAHDGNIDTLSFDGHCRRYSQRPTKWQDLADNVPVHNYDHVPTVCDRLSTLWSNLWKSGKEPATGIKKRIDVSGLEVHDMSSKRGRIVCADPENEIKTFRFATKN